VYNLIFYYIYCNQINKKKEEHYPGIMPLLVYLSPW